MSTETTMPPETPAEARSGGGVVLQRLVRLCLCGCGTEVRLDDRGRGGNYVRGHFHRGKKHRPEWCEAQGAGLAKAWQDPTKFQTMRHQSRELVEKRIAPIRGVKKPEWFGAKISKALTGRKLSPEHRAKAAANGFKGPQFLTAEQQKRRNESISKQRKGTHNFGRAARDRLDHFNALHWIVRDNRGVIHEFDNLQSWARANEHRFLPDDRPESKLALWKRAVGGFNNMQRTDRKASHQWKGWTLVSVLERRQQCAPDLLARDAQPNDPS